MKANSKLNHGLFRSRKNLHETPFTKASSSNKKHYKYNPTTMKTVLQSIYDQEEEEENPLQIKFKCLELEWESIKQSIPRSNRLFHLYNKSPKPLISMLQQNEHLHFDFPNSQRHDRVAIEIIEQREADFDNGRFRGRKLFEEPDDYGGGCFEIEKSEVSTEFSWQGFENCDDGSSRLCGFRRSGTDSPPREEAEMGVMPVAVKSGDGGNGGSRRRLLICIALMLAIAIVAVNFWGEDEDILVPT